MGTLVDVTDGTFEQEVLRAEQPVLVDFWAPWCGPCKAVSAVLADLAAQHRDRLKVVKVDIGQHQAYAAKLRVQSTPTLVLFKDGQPIDRAAGALPRHAIVDLLNQHLGEASART